MNTIVGEKVYGDSLHPGITYRALKDGTLFIDDSAQASPDLLDYH